MGAKAKAIVIHRNDNVATALRALARGTKVPVEIQGRTEVVTLVSDIPIGHKFALMDIEKGQPVIKYGQPIGDSKTTIARGEHVHVQNVASQPRRGVRR